MPGPVVALPVLTAFWGSLLFQGGKEALKDYVIRTMSHW